MATDFPGVLQPALANGGGPIMARFSIRTRLIFLTGVVLASLLASNAYLGWKLSQNARILTEQAEIVSVLTISNGASKAFGDLKYWLADLAVSLLMLAERNAYEARDRLLERLQALEPHAPETVTAVREEAEAMVEQAMRAVDAYTADQRVIGNARMAQARAHIQAVDIRLGTLVGQFEAAALEKRDAALRATQEALWLSLLVATLVTVTGLILTVVVVRSITGPLTHLVDSMSAITGGDLDAEVPHAGRDEIGAMARTLALFRESLIAGRRLAAEREAAEAAMAKAQARLAAAIEASSEGFALYDPDDRLVVCNSKYRNMYAGLEVEIGPGTRYEDIIKEAVSAGLIAEARGREKEWIAQRAMSHRSPGPPHEQQRTDGRWFRISERRTGDGGVVGVFTEVTELKQNEQRVANANRLILDSLRYASRIQSAVLPPRDAFTAATADHFLLWEPRDIVGGDFFWFRRGQEGCLVLVGDCTGHGVPGAFMTLIVTGLLDRIARDLPPEPGRLLSNLHRELQGLLGQNEGVGQTDDGLDAGLCFLSKDGGKLIFAGARFGLWQARDGEVKEVKGERIGLGYRRVPANSTFSDITLDVAANDRFYLTTDGLIGQIGDARAHSFGKRRFAQFITQYHAHSMAEQKETLSRLFAHHQGRQPRRDDVMVLGFTPLDGCQRAG
jgi:serine phosphatase RsbU (regulator of sigma subunit)/PAS domain-containing protein